MYDGCHDQCVLPGSVGTAAVSYTHLDVYKRQAVDDLNMSIEQGSLVGLIGPNGAGKTTAFNLLTGVYAPSEGTIVLDGESLVGKTPTEICKSGIARTFQNIRLFSKMTVLDNVKVALHNHCLLYTSRVFARIIF